VLRGPGALQNNQESISSIFSISIPISISISISISIQNMIGLIGLIGNPGLETMPYGARVFGRA